MTVEELLSRLRHLGVALRAGDGTLHWSAAEGVVTDDIRDLMRRRKQEILEHLRASSAIRPAPRSDSMPLSSGQQRLWAIQQLDPGDTRYVCPAVVRLRGVIDPDRLRSAVERIVKRHEILRSRFHSKDGLPFVEIRTQPEIPIRLEVGSPSPDFIPELVAREESIGFDLERDPPIRARIVQLGPQDHLLMVTTHHIVSDAWSLGVMLGDLARAYEQQPLPPLAIQFADYAVWQRGRIAQPELVAQVDYWSARLRNPPVLELSPGRTRDPRCGGAQRTFRVPESLARDVERRAREVSSTPFVVLLAAYYALLVRASGQDDLVIGTPVAGRSRPELEPLIGFFINTLALRIDLRAIRDSATLIGAVRRTVLEGLENQEAPFDRVIDAVRPPRRVDRNPLFDVHFVFTNVPLPEMRIGSARVEPQSLERRRARFDLSLELAVVGKTIEGIVEYRRDLFEEEQIDGWIASYLRMIEALTRSEPIDFRSFHLDERMSLVVANGHADEVAKATMSLAPVAGTNGIEECLVEVFSEVLGRPVGRSDDFFVSGGDSILAMRVASRARVRGLRVRPADLFSHPTCEALAFAAVWMVADPDAEEVPSDGSLIPLTATQRWFLDGGPRHPHHFNQAVLVEVDTSVTPERLTAALAALVRRHDALRLRLDLDLRMQRIVDTEAAAIRTQIVDEADFPRAVEEAHASLDISNGPIARAVFCKREDGPRVFLVVHHLAIDAVSWRILLEDLDSALDSAERGEPIRLPNVPCTWSAWARHQITLGAGPDTLSEARYWTRLLLDEAVALPADREGENTVGSAASVRVRFSREETERLLIEVPKILGVRIDEVLLTAVTIALCAWSGHQQIRVDVESHGRLEAGDLDLSRTVGWLTSIYPVMLQPAVSLHAPASLLRVKEALRGVPRMGIGYGLLRYASTSPVPQVAGGVLFNYLGQVDAGTDARRVRVLWPPPGRAKAAENDRSHTFEVGAWVAARQLELSWTYSTERHLSGTVEALAERAAREIRGLADVRMAPSISSPKATPSDFPLAGLPQAQLDRLLRRGSGPLGDVEPGEKRRDR